MVGRDDGGNNGNPGDGGLGDGPGSDDWCRFKPFPWIPVEFEYRIVPNPAYVGQFGPLAFEDPWWKVLLIVLAILLAVASLIYDYIKAGEDPNFVIGNITAKSTRTTSNVDAAIARLNGSRGNDLNVLEAQVDDRNNGMPINGVTGGSVAIDRSDNGDRGIEDAVLGNVVFKSGARSATTRGSVSGISLDVPVDGINYTNQVFILPLPAPNNQPLSQGGDSGSLWIDLTSRRPVALNFAGPTSNDGSNAIANPIRDVVNLAGSTFALTHRRSIMATREKFAQQLEKAIEVADRLAPELLRRPEVVAVGPGLKRRKGKPTGEAAIVITVREKSCLKELKERGEQPLPKEFGRFAGGCDRISETG